MFFRKFKKKKKIEGHNNFLFSLFVICLNRSKKKCITDTWMSKHIYAQGTTIERTFDTIFGLNVVRILLLPYVTYLRIRCREGNRKREKNYKKYISNAIALI